MTTAQAVLVAALCVALASAETLHGIVRTLWLNRWLGKAKALRWSAVSGAGLAFAVCWLFVPAIGLHTPVGALALGIGLATFMAAFDIALARWLLRRAWPKVWADFNPATGNYLLWGLLALMVFPLVIGRWLV